MRTVFIIQGEGRGHTTKAISYYENNPDLEPVCIITSDQREDSLDLSDTFKDVPIFKLKSLNFKYKNGKISWVSTFFSNLFRIPVFVRNLWYVNRAIRIIEPDLVLNFYEPLAMFANPKHGKKISIGNQYLFYTDFWKFPGYSFNYFAIMFWNWITSLGSYMIFAPSFIDGEGNDKVEVMKPLIRNSVKDRRVRNGNYVLVYLIDEDIIKFFVDTYASKFPYVHYILFCDSNFNATLPKNVTRFDLDPDNFADVLAGCNEVISTGGFQLICECLEMGKHITVIPVHYEQEINGYNLEYYALGEMQKM